MSSFWNDAEAKLAEQFLRDGYVIQAADDPSSLDRIQTLIADLAGDFLGESPSGDCRVFLDHVHQKVTADRVNDLRLHVIQGMNSQAWLRQAYFTTARRTIETIVGNELCMQRRVNLSVQLPGDESSVLASHADVWSGDSPFEVVLWIPLVDCAGTKSMFLAPPAIDAEIQARLASHGSVERAFSHYQDQVRFLDIPYGHVLLFNQNLMHGNRLNTTGETRWSMNCRFKSIMSPYADKKLGEFFEPITLRPATRLGMTYRLPEGFHEE
jgi:sporadic carbohydrate cluster 2OG-Fe(II) oxygenase